MFCGLIQSGAVRVSCVGLLVYKAQGWVIIKAADSQDLQAAIGRTSELPVTLNSAGPYNPKRIRADLKRYYGMTHNSGSLL
jgi:hypothetical protein